MNLPKQASDERRLVLLDTAAYAAKNAASILDPQQLLQRTVGIINEAFDFYYAGIFLLDETSQWAVLRASYGDAGTAMVSEGHKLKVGGNSMIGTAIATHQARIALDIGREAVHFQNPHLPKTRSEMALPLLVGAEVIGALSVQSVEEAAFTLEDITVLQSMADQLAIAIKNSQLHRQNQELLRQTKRRAHLLQAVHEVGRKVIGILDMDDLLPKAVDIICEAYGYYYAGVFLLDESGEWAILNAGRSPVGAAMVAKGHKLQVGGCSMIGAAIHLRETRIAMDIGDETIHFKNPFLPHTRSEMALPLVVGNTVLGAVTVQSIEENAFSTDDITALQIVADQLAIAIHNAQLLGDVKNARAALQRSEPFEALATVTTEAVHRIGDKALPITITAASMSDDLAGDDVDAQSLDLQSLREDLDLIAEHARQIVHARESLLGAAREQHPRPVLLADIWQAAAHDRQVPAKTVTIENDPQTPLVLADSTQLVRAFGNLLQNAMEAEAKKIRIEIGPAEEKGFVRTRLFDDGIGIPPEALDKIWTTFLTTKGADHQGLGMAACLNVIMLLDGRINVDSEIKKGTTFTILLPISPEKITLPDFSNVARNIILIDDDDEWAHFVTQTLVGVGKNVSRQKALHGAAAADLILVDQAIQAPPLETILKQLQDVEMAHKAILVAAALKTDNITDFLQTGIKDAVLKPYTPDELARLLT